MSKSTLKPAQQSLFKATFGGTIRRRPLLLLMWNQWNVDVCMVKWWGCKVMQSAMPDHLACLFRAPLCCHQLVNLNVKTVPTQPSCLTSDAAGEGASSFAPLLQNVDERWLRRNQTSLTGRWLPSQDNSWLTVLVTSLGWEATLSPLNSSDFCYPRCYVVLLLWCSLVFFLSSSLLSLP